MKQWMLALVVAGAGALGTVQAGGYNYGYGSCCDSSCQPCNPCSQPCDPCCDPCCCDPCWDSCWDSCWCGGVEVIGEYLFIRPHQCDLNYVIVDPTPFGTLTATPGAGSAEGVDGFLPNGSEKGVCPDYTSAFRVGLGYLFNCGCNDITVTYERLNTRHNHRCGNGDSASTGAPLFGGLWITTGHPRYENLRLNNAIITGATTGGVIAPGAVNAFAQERVRTLYNTVEGVVGMRQMKGCDLWMRGFVGLKWSDFTLCQSANYQGTVTQVVTVGTTPTRIFQNEFDFVQNRGYSWGIGPRVGGDVRYEVLCGFGVGAHVGASILVGESHHKIFQTVTRTTVSPTGVVVPVGTDFTQTLDVNNRSHCILFPEFDARLGINYLWCCGDCFSLLIEVGWEFETYINAIGRIRFNDFAGTNREVCESFDIDGLYVSLKLTI